MLASGRVAKTHAEVGTGHVSDLVSFVVIDTRIFIRWIARHHLLHNPNHQTTTATHLTYLTELIQDIVADFENRLAKLESVAYRLSSSITIPASAASSSSSSDQLQQQLLPRRSSPDPIPTPSLLNLSFAKDPRLRRQSTASSTNTKSTSQPNPSKCNQQ
ncbi:hypothetical protein PCASD_22137 [Puccinia coronata f. sp. avenae]|uniref:Uncharacterized protein n=1 Tax=Puccinia coronata f. sp. avenae TaxID=200324 RepID=A0A2N5TNV3_9BASI|nr:hypothetical protein PCASD_22137 [Puccinia coronata f. sp. avenae]